MAQQTRQHGSKHAYKPSFGRSKSIKAPLAVSLTCIGVGLIFLIWAITPVFVAATQQNPDPAAALARLSELVEESQELRDMSVAHYEGRYAFNQRDVKPWPTPRRVVETPVARPRVAEPVKPVVPRGPSEAPAKYGGPQLIALAGFEAWFEGGSDGPTRVMLGQESDNLRLIGFISSKAAKVGWQRNKDTKWGEYEVPVFDRDGDGPWSEVASGRLPSGLELIKEVEVDKADGSPLTRPINSMPTGKDDLSSDNTRDAEAGIQAREVLEASLKGAADAADAATDAIGDTFSNAAKATGNALKEAFSDKSAGEQESEETPGGTDADE